MQVRCCRFWHTFEQGRSFVHRSIPMRSFIFADFPFFLSLMQFADRMELTQKQLPNLGGLAES